MAMAVRTVRSETLKERAGEDDGDVAAGAGYGRGKSVRPSVIGSC